MQHLEVSGAVRHIYIYIYIYIYMALGGWRLNDVSVTQEYTMFNVWMIWCSELEVMWEEHEVVVVYLKKNMQELTSRNSKKQKETSNRIFGHLYRESNRQNAGQNCYRLSQRTRSKFVMNNVAMCYSRWHNMYYISRIKNLKTCFSYNEPSSGQRQNEVLVQLMIVHSMGSHIV